MERKKLAATHWATVMPHKKRIRKEKRWKREEAYPHILITIAFASAEND